MSGVCVFLCMLECTFRLQSGDTLAGPHMFKWHLEGCFRFKMSIWHFILMFRVNVRGLESPRIYTSTRACVCVCLMETTTIALFDLFGVLLCVLRYTSSQIWDPINRKVTWPWKTVKVPALAVNIRTSPGVTDTTSTALQLLKSRLHPRWKAISVQRGLGHQGHSILDYTTDHNLTQTFSDASLGGALPTGYYRHKCFNSTAFHVYTWFVLNFFKRDPNKNGISILWHTFNNDTSATLDGSQHESAP